MLPNMMRETVLAFTLITIFASIGAVPQRLRPQCRSKNVCDDRPQCPISSCNCLFPSGMDCAIYYQCIKGKPYQYKCSPGLLFNEDTLTCDYSYNVNCSIGTTTSTTVTRTDQPETTEHISTKTTVKFTTTDRPKEPTTTTEEIISITTTKPTTTTEATEKPTTVKTTEEATTTKITEEPQTSRITEEHTTTEPTEEITTAKTTETSTKEKTDNPFTTITTEEIITIKTIEEPTTTSREGTTFVKTTKEPTTTTVTEEPHSTKITDEPITTRRPTTTEKTEGPTTFKTTEKPTTATEEPITSKNTDGFSTAKTTPSTTSETASPNSTTSEIRTVSTTINSSSDFLCPTRFGLFPDPENCFKFYHCSHWIPYHKWCPSNLHFNPDLKVCDWPYRAGCALSTTVVFSTPTSALPEEPTTKKITEDITTTKTSVYTSVKTTNEPTTVKTTEKPTTTKVTETSIVSETTKGSTTEVTTFTTTVQPTSTETTEGSTTRKTTADLTTVNTAEPTTTTTTENPTTTVKYVTTKSTEEPTTTKTPLPTTRETTKEPSTAKTTESVSTETEKPTTTETASPTTAKITRETTNTETTQGTTTIKTTAEPSTVKTTQEQPSTAKTTKEPTTTKSPTESTAVSTETTFIITKSTVESSSSKPTVEPTTSKNTTERLSTTETSKEANTGTTIKVPSTTKLTETTSSSEIQTVSTINPSSDFLCPSRFGLFPDPNSCFRFYHCSHWIPHHKWCPSNLHFNPKLKVCDWPYRAGCDTVWPTPSEPDNPVTSNPNDTYGTCDCDCCELPVPGDCNAYMLCINKVAFIMRCSPGLYFNPMTGTCDYKENVNCPGDDVTCPEPTGRYLLPGSCSYFIECHGGKKDIRKCPEGLQFNQSSEMCSWLGSCADQQPDGDASSKTITDNVICDGCDYCFKLFEEDCSSYARCQQNVATVEHCAPGLFFNPDTEMCDHDYNVECPEPQPPPVCPQTFGYFPYPGECGMYLKCVNGSAIVKHCPGTLHFDPVRKHCDFPWTAGCSDSDSLPTVTPTGDSVNCDCDCCLKPVGTDCRSFIVCINGIGLVGSCSSGLLFNPETESCDFVENVNCPITPEIPEYICHDHQGLFPHPEDCHRFINCVHGFPYVKVCPSDLHFNPKLKVCDWPYSAGCQDPQPTDPPTDDNEFPCEVCDSCFIRNEVDCAVYIYCLNSKGRKFRCADNLLFNPETETCDLATNVQCPNQPPSECSKPEGLFPASDCTQFIHCSNGIAYLKDCPHGLVFNPLFLVCDWPENVKCGEIPVLPTPPDDSGDTSNITCNCDCCFLPYSKDCSKYILCLDGHAHIGQCSRGLLFNSETQNCDVAERVTCGQKPPLCPEPNGLFPNQDHCSSYLKCTGGTVEIEYCQSGAHYSIDMKQCTDPCKAKCDSSYDCSTKPEDVSTSPAPSICLEPDGFYPVTGDCSSFYVCSNGQPQRVMCPNGLHYNTEYEICEDPCDAQCDQMLDCVSPSPETTPATSPRPSDPRCHQGNGLYPDEDDCSSFWHCSHGKSYHKKCPSGLHFSPVKESCLRPCDAKCNSTIDCPGPKPKTTPATTPLPLDPRCLKKNGLYPDKDNCSSYLHCSHGIAHRKGCPSGLHFSNFTKNCEFPCVAKCNTSIDCSSTTPKPISTLSPHCPTAEGIYPVSGDCTSFYICSNGKDFSISCPPGLHYSKKDEICQDPCVAQCNTSLNCNATTKPEIPSTTPHPISPECLKPDGRFPNPKDCGSYYQCSSGKSSLIFCPSGLHFSKDDSGCTQPCVAGCDLDIDCPGPKPKTTPATTPLPLDPRCLKKNGLYPDKDNCSSYLHCSHGIAHRKGCPSGLHFSNFTKNCEFPCVAKCNTSIDCSSTTPKPISTFSPHCPTADGIYPVSGDCTSFYICSNGKEFSISCPPGLHYSKKDEICEDPCVAQCNTSLNCNATTKPDIPSTTPHPISPECLKPDGRFPNPKDCGSYYQCSSGKSSLIFCPSGLHFSKDDSGCRQPCAAGCDLDIDCPSELPDPKGNCTCELCFLPDPSDCSAHYRCKNGKLTKMYCVTGKLFSKKSRTCEDEENVDCEARGDPSMCPEPFGTFPYPGNCSKFVHCDDGIANIQQCKEGLKYDPQSRECTKSSEFCEEPVQDPSCPKPTGIFPDPSNCSLFFQCEHGVAYHKRCPPPLMFNPNQEVCDWPKNVACGNNTTDASTTSISPFSSTSNPPSPSPTFPACYEVPGVICPCACRVPSYEECNSYFQCQEDGTACKRFCPEGLYFNKVEMICDLPENVECRDFFFTSLRRAKRLGKLLSFSTTSSLNT